MKRFYSLCLIILLLLSFSSCEHNVYIDEKIDAKDVWCVGLIEDGNFFKTANEAIEFIIQKSNLKGVSTEESRTIHLLRHVLAQDSDGVALYGKEYVLPEQYRKEITVPETYKGALCIDFGGYRYDFANTIDYFFTIKGGDEVYIYNGDSVIFKESQSPITNPALIVGTRTVTIDEHLIDDRREGPEKESPAAVLVTEEGTLVITSEKEKRSQTGVSGTFTVNEGGVVKIEEGTVTIADIIETSKTDITITGGEIHNPHKIEERITESIPEENREDVDRKIVHSPLKHFEGKAPTCLEGGNIEYWQCENEGCLKLFSDEQCLHEITIEETKLEKIPHELFHHKKVEATCTSTGMEEYWECRSCRKLFKDSKAEIEITDLSTLVIEKKNHNYTTEWNYDNKYHWHECAVCHNPSIHEEHVFNEGVVTKAPTEHKKGIKTYTCTSCGFTKEEDIPELDHIWQLEETVLPTCTERGYKLSKCQNPDCDQKVKYDYTDPLGHKGKKIEAKAATCTENGNIEYWVCTRDNCGTISSTEQFTNIITLDQTVIQALGHKLTEYKYDSEKHWHDCENNINEKLDVGTHNTDRICQDGETGHHWECTVCGYATEIEAHIFNTDGYCAECGFHNPVAAQGGGGFNVEIVIKEPSGDLSYSFSSGKYTVEYHDTNTSYPATRFEWYLNNNKQSEDGSSFTFVPSGPYTHTVMCVYSNEFGTGSITKVISGK